MALETMCTRLDTSEIERLDALALVLAERAHGARITRSNALRVVVEAGLNALEGQHRAERAKAKR